METLFTVHLKDPFKSKHMEILNEISRYHFHLKHVRGYNKYLTDKNMPGLLFTFKYLGDATDTNHEIIKTFGYFYIYDETTFKTTIDGLAAPGAEPVPSAPVIPGKPTVTYNESSPVISEPVTASFSSESNITKYSWETRADSSSEWQGYIGPGTFSKIVTPNTDSYQYRITWIRSGYEETIDTIFTVNDHAPNITYNVGSPSPGDDLIANFSFTHGVSNYQWQVEGPVNTWTDVAGETSLTLTIPSGASTGDKYRLSWDRNGTIEYSIPVTVG